MNETQGSESAGGGENQRGIVKKTVRKRQSETTSKRMTSVRAERGTTQRVRTKTRPKTQ